MTSTTTISRFVILVFQKKPDIIDYTSKSIIEIKPLRRKDMADGYADLLLELTYANALNIPGASNCFCPGAPWKPNLWLPSVRVVSIPHYPTHSAFIVGNFGGLLVYKRFNMPKRDLENQLSVEMIREIEKEFQQFTLNFQDNYRHRMLQQFYHDLPLLLMAMSIQSAALTVSHAIGKAAMVPAAQTAAIKTDYATRMTLTTSTRGLAA